MHPGTNPWPRIRDDECARSGPVPTSPFLGPLFPLASSTPLPWLVRRWCGGAPRCAASAWPATAPCRSGLLLSRTPYCRLWRGHWRLVYPRTLLPLPSPSGSLPRRHGGAPRAPASVPDSSSSALGTCVCISGPNMREFLHASLDAMASNALHVMTCDCGDLGSTQTALAC